MEGTVATLLQLGAAVQTQCTAATAHLLQLLSSPPGIVNPPRTGSAVLVFSEGLMPSSFACLLGRVHGSHSHFYTEATLLHVSSAGYCLFVQVRVAQACCSFQVQFCPI